VTETKGAYLAINLAHEQKRTDDARMKIRNGLRLLLQGVEELWRLPRSFETKGEKGKR